MNNFNSIMENQSLNKTTDPVLEPIKDMNKTQDQIASTHQNTSGDNSDPKKEGSQ